MATKATAKSAAWQAKARAEKEAAGFACQICGAAEGAWSYYLTAVRSSAASAKTLTGSVRVFGRP